MIIAVNDNFDIEQTAYSGQCFRAKALPGSYVQFVTGNHLICLKDITAAADDVEVDVAYFMGETGGCRADCANSVEKYETNKNNADKYRGSASESKAECLVERPSIRYFEATCTLKDWKEVWENYFDLGYKYKDVLKSIPEGDVYAMNSYNFSSGIRILNQDRFETLISFIISQRKSIPAISSAVEKISKKYGTPIGSNTEGEILYSFPTPDQLMRATKEELADCGLGYRVDYVLDAVRRVVTGELDLEMMTQLPDDELFEKLKTVNGVGDKVSNCVSLFGYHRIGRAPVDTWIAKVINEEYNGINPFDRYGEVAGIVQQYIFFYARQK